MKTAFSEYATSHAFHVSLSQLQIDVLLFIDDRGAADQLTLGLPHDFRVYSALKRKGLIHWKGEGDTTHGPYLTEAGRALCPLLRLAGFGSNRKRGAA